MNQIVKEQAPNFSGFFAGAGDHFANQDQKLVLSVELCRHGEKIPSKVFDFTEDPNGNFYKTWFPRGMGLTDVGHKSSYINGQILRKFFDQHDGFLSATYDPREIYVQTDNEYRTNESAPS